MPAKQSLGSAGRALRATGLGVKSGRFLARWTRDGLLHLEYLILEVLVDEHVRARRPVEDRLEQALLAWAVEGIGIVAHADVQGAIGEDVQEEGPPESVLRIARHEDVGVDVDALLAERHLSRLELV